MVLRTPLWFLPALLFCSAAFSAQPDTAYFSKNRYAYLYPSTVAGKSFVPGLGHFSLDRYSEGYTVIGMEAGALGVLLLAAQNKDSELAALSGTTLQDILLYSIYDSYIKTRQQWNNYGYSQPIADEGVWDHVLAPLNLTYLMRWTTLLPLAFPLYQVISDHFQHDGALAENLRYRLTTPSVISLNAAVGEEGFFRGFMFQEMEHRMGTAWALLLSSTAFGAAHYRLGAGYEETGVTLAVTSSLGLYFNWLTKYRGYSLKENIFIHFWWDFILIGYSAFSGNSFYFSKNLSWDF